VSIEGALEQALETTPLLPRDITARQLALRYAEALDEAFDALVAVECAEDGAAHARKVLEIARLGQRLEVMLDRLGMTPAARPVVPNEGGSRGGSSPESDSLDQLRRDAAAGAPNSGIDYAAAVDPAVTEADAED
jgi:hypothetical protein